MYLNILLFDNSITSAITYHGHSMELKFMISQEILMQGKITIGDYKEQEQQGQQMFLVHIRLVFMCYLYVATSMCWLCVRLTQFACVLCMHVIYLQFSVIICSTVCSFVQQDCSFLQYVCKTQCSLNTKYCDFCKVITLGSLCLTLTIGRQQVHT